MPAGGPSRLLGLHMFVKENLGKPERRLLRTDAQRVDAHDHEAPPLGGVLARFAASAVSERSTRGQVNHDFAGFRVVCTGSPDSAGIGPPNTLSFAAAPGPTLRPLTHIFPFSS